MHNMTHLHSPLEIAAGHEMDKDDKFTGWGG